MTDLEFNRLILDLAAFVGLPDARVLSETGELQIGDLIVRLHRPSSFGDGFLHVDATWEQIPSKLECKVWRQMLELNRDIARIGGGQFALDDRNCPLFTEKIADLRPDGQSITAAELADLLNHWATQASHWGRIFK